MLIECSAVGDGGNGKRRAVVQDIGWTAGSGGANLCVEVLLLPGSKHFGLGHGKVRLHGEIRARQIDGLLQVYALGVHSVSSTLVYQSLSQNRRRWAVLGS